MEPFQTSLHGLEIGIRPGHSLPTVDEALLYANKPLPPLPPPRHPQRRRIPRKPVGSGDSRQNSRTSSPSPGLDGRALAISLRNPPDNKWRAVSPISSRRSSAQQDPALVTQRAHKEAVEEPLEHEGRPSTSSQRSTTFPSLASSKSDRRNNSHAPRKPGHRSQLLYSSGVPSLEPDNDGISSKNSSWGPPPIRTNGQSSPRIDNTAIRQSNDSKLSVDFVLPRIVFEDDLASRWDESYGCSTSSVDMSLHENTSLDGSPHLQVPSLYAPLPSSSCPSFFAVGQTSRRVGPPRPIKASTTCLSPPKRTPYPEQAFFASQLNLSTGAHSAFDSDSSGKDMLREEDIMSARQGIKNLFTKRSLNRSSSLEFLSPRFRRRSDAQVSGRHLSGLFAGTKERLQNFRADRRRDVLRKQIRVVSLES